MPYILTFLSENLIYRSKSLTCVLSFFSSNSHTRKKKKLETRFSFQMGKKKRKNIFRIFSTLIDASKLFPRLFSEM